MSDGYNDRKSEREPETCNCRGPGRHLRGADFTCLNYCKGNYLQKGKLVKRLGYTCSWIWVPESSG